MTQSRRTKPFHEIPSYEQIYKQLHCQICQETTLHIDCQSRLRPDWQCYACMTCASERDWRNSDDELKSLDAPYRRPASKKPASKPYQKPGPKGPWKHKHKPANSCYTSVKQQTLFEGV